MPRAGGIKQTTRETGLFRGFKKFIFQSLKISFFVVPLWIGATSLNSEDSGFFTAAIICIWVPLLLVIQVMLLLLASPFNEGSTPRQGTLRTASIIGVYYILILILGMVLVSSEIAKIPLPLSIYDESIGVWQSSQLSFEIPRAAFVVAILAIVSLMYDRVLYKIKLHVSK